MEVSGNDIDKDVELLRLLQIKEEVAAPGAANLPDYSDDSDSDISDYWVIQKQANSAVHYSS